MRKVALVALVALFTISGLAMAAQPKLVDAKITPEKASVGDKVTVTVEFSGKAKDLKQVYLTVREYPYDGPTIVLKPVEGKKNVWTAEETVPYEAPAETFNLDITAVDKKGKEIVTEGFEDNYTGKAGSVKLQVTL